MAPTGKVGGSSHLGMERILIILDTCIIRGLGLESASAELLRTIRESGIEDVAVPWIVMEELAAQHAVTYMTKYAAAVGALETLQRATPWELPGMMTARNPERVREHWRAAYRGIVNVIPTSDAALREAALREANALPPASKAEKAGGRGPKSGYRDVAVWLSAIEYAKAHPAETVYFVSANTKDFGDGSAYEYPMDQDLDGLKDRFVHLIDVDAVVSRIAEPTDVPVERIREVLATSEVCATISDRAFDNMQAHLGRSPYEMSTFRTGDLQRLAQEWLAGWTEPPVAVLDSVRDIQTYKVAENEWCTATVRWILGGLALVLTPSFAVASAWSSWETRVLFTPQDGSRLVVLRSGPSAEVTSEEATRFLNAAPSRPEGFPSPHQHTDLRKFSGIGFHELPGDLGAEFEDIVNRLLAVHPTGE
ncbi:hypothetical protein GCM10020295_36420 [Streptomyces cinereospinus]